MSGREAPLVKRQCPAPNAPPLASLPGSGHLAGMDQHRVSLERIRRGLEAPPAGSSDFDLNPEVPVPAGPRLRPASVLVPLVERGSGLAVILTRRAALLKSHPGQVAFPGGKQEDFDPTPADAALREAREEIGLEPGMVEILGPLDPHRTVTGFVVSPFVGLVAPGFLPVPDRGEVDEVFEVPLAFALDPANLQIHGRRWNGMLRRYYVIPYGPHYVWGATARMLKALSDRVMRR
jgi:8-oxo-dGTP pyrophosphatase MutT (NUDIX family)